MQLKYIFNPFLGAVLIISAMIFNSCRKFLEPEFKTQVAAIDVFANDNNAKSSLLGMYAVIANENTAFSGQITRSTGFSSDELVYFTNDDEVDQLTQNAIEPGLGTIKSTWDKIYYNVFQANSIIEGSEASAGMTAEFKKQAIGEAKFIRAFCHFYLVNLFGDVPLITATAKEITAFKPRTPKAEVYRQIVTDLTDAYNSLPSDNSLNGNKRNRANKWAAAALLARVYLYTNDFANAETYASAVIANTSLYALQSNLSNVYLKNRSESIFELERLAFNTAEGDMFTLYFQILGFGDHLIRDELSVSFQSGDKRKATWVKSTLFGPIPYRYKSPATNEENYIVLRLPEMYLIRAEALSQQNKFAEAQNNLNIIRNRAGLPALTNVVDKATAMIAVENERRHELFCEWGHRWFDLRRWPSTSTPGKTRADDVLGALKGSTWQSTDIYFPIPTDAINKNPNLTQNSGY